MEKRRLETDADLTPPYPSRFRRALVIAGTALVFVIAGLLIPIPFGGRAAVALGDLMHAPLFGGMTLGVLLLWNFVWPIDVSTPASEPDLSMDGQSFADGAFVVRSVVVGMALFLFGVGIEFAQAYSGRSFAIHDAVANGLGITAALFWYWAMLVRKQRPGEKSLPRTLRLATCVLLVVAWWGPVAMLLDVAAKYTQFPMLASFETETEFQRFFFRGCQPRRSKQDATTGKYSMEVLYEPGEYPSATLVEMIPDWSQVKSLCVDVTLDASHDLPQATFMLKVTDSDHNGKHEDTFRKQWDLGPGESVRVLIPRQALIDGPDDRELNLESMRFVDLMMLDVQVPTLVRIDALRLELE